VVRVSWPTIPGFLCRKSTAHQQFLNELLQRDFPLRGYTLLIWGGCIAETLVQSAPTDWHIDHLLYQSGLHERPLVSSQKSYDSLLLALSARTIFGQAAQRLCGIHDADVLLQRTSTSAER
jgi:hypothetical protein